MSSTLFLTDDEIVQLTGRRLKSRQIEWLRQNGIPFRVNATGHPVVTRSSVETRPTEQGPQPRRRWTPKAVGV